MALWASSITKRTILEVSKAFFSISFCKVWGVMKNTLLERYSFVLFSTDRFPVSSVIWPSGTSVMREEKASTYYATRGLVGATKKMRPSWNHLKKLKITVEAMKVFPSPVGKVTKVF